VSEHGARFVLMLQIANPAKRDQVISDVQKQVYSLLPELDGHKQPQA